MRLVALAALLLVAGLWLGRVDRMDEGWALDPAIED